MGRNENRKTTLLRDKTVSHNSGAKVQHQTMLETVFSSPKTATILQLNNNSSPDCNVFSLQLFPLQF